MTDVLPSNGTTPTPSPQRERARLAAVIIQVQAFADDGTSLRPLAVEPIHLSLTDFPHFDLELVLAQIQAHLDGTA